MSVDISPDAEFLGIAKSNGSIIVYQQGRDQRFYKFVHCSANDHAVNHYYFSPDGKHILFEPANGTLQISKIEYLRERKKIIDTGQIIDFERHLEASWFQFSKNGLLLLISMRSKIGTGEEFVNRLYQRIESTGQYEYMLQFSGYAFKMDFSEDNLLFICGCYPYTAHKYVRRSVDENFQKMSFAENELPQVIYLPPGTKNAFIGTRNNEVIYYQFNEESLEHERCCALNERFDQLVNCMMATPNLEIMVFGSLDGMIKIGRRSNKDSENKKICYEITQRILAEDVPTDCYITRCGKMVIAPLNNNIISIYTKNQKGWFEQT